ncbi:MAG: family 2A encapsulin nanocompartment cargo protein cysteine desulfurase, partial [Hyphomicrobium sp.]
MSIADPLRADAPRGGTDLDALAAAATGFAGGVSPPAGLPDVAVLTRLANEMFSAVPGQANPLPAGPSLGGAGASPADVGGKAAPHALEIVTTSVPHGAANYPLGAPSSGSPFDASGIDQIALNTLLVGSVPAASSLLTAAPSTGGFGVSPGAVDASALPASRDVTVIDLRAFDTLVLSPDVSLPPNVDAGPSLAGVGVSTGSVAVPQSAGTTPTGANQSSLPQPPDPAPPPPVLIDHSGIGAPQSAATTRPFSVIPMPFETELQALLAPLTRDRQTAAHKRDEGTLPYFIGDVGQSVAGIGVPGQPATGFDADLAAANAGFDVDAIRRDF